MDYLLGMGNQIERIKRSPSILFMLDFDGTLSPIVQDPANAELPEDTRTLLENLKDRNGITIAVISGRALKDIMARVGISDIVYVGNHGLEVHGIEPLWKEGGSKAVREVAEAVEKSLTRLPGVVFEDKGPTLSIHYRMMDPTKVPALMEKIDAITKPQMDDLRVTHGRKVVEIRPAGVPDKGDIAVHLTSHFPSALPVFIGDDTTDEDAFRALGDKDGVAVLVTSLPKESAAKYFLKDPEDVKRFLKVLGDV